ncbi:RagB/SusD family nutrient uptake outer membrane protein [Arthrospiribacter ruber]|uniref:RagB/SusD family nutrient uptake outer membrane protein n=1 Tax=Arthrospiribacter ruber TaxID=2487934 RepID=A0A951J2Y8_9BACT|nr:RagB/SusD family nutrient uptake outer membrane protein [Arthrospiribacter ruber]MBW3466816.1 RagB/SusD family nutrient uptake outer membrane protein [Arthrospiribacter ruber]MBW3469608.1 RagB/SusD family nutrient uptake outer membrane protein [Arthrospiribacter ruber]MBW3470317.1 RagB/SusD family nutrient uptake outer membrane protein [Arthrospiribacter ruber]
MKNIKTYILALGIGCTAASCTGDFLDTEPITELTDENFYRTTNDAYRALVGCYEGLHQIWAGGVSFPVASEVLSDNAFGGTGSADGFGYQMLDEFDRNRSTADQNLFQDNWSAYYSAIFRINSFLQRMDQIDWEDDDALRLRYESEIRFLRAFLYFDMVRLWGNIPLLTEPSPENIPQAEPEEVYRVIAEDLQFAAENLEAIPGTSQPSSEFGRVTKWAANALIGRVYLYYTGYYQQPDLAGVITGQQALAYMEDVIQSGGYGLVEEFSQLWPAASLEDYAGELNEEVIFSIRYTYTSDYDGNTDGNHWMVMLGIREQSFFPYGRGWGGATVNPRLYNAFNENDARREASIIAIEEEGLPFTNFSRQREYTGYYTKKYSPMINEDGVELPVDLGAPNHMIGQFQDYFVIRYADVLLMAAELGSPNAQTYFDDVRRRAYGENFSSLAITPNRLLEERRLEFALEGIRYWDLLRQGVDFAANVIGESSTVLNAGSPVSKVINPSNIITTEGLQQIPNNQIILSDNVLVQNPGW